MSPARSNSPDENDEAERLHILHALGILDTPPDEEFDALVQAAALVCETPIALVSLVDAERQWFKANYGLPGVQETPRNTAFCAHTVRSDEILEVRDATLDPRFADNPNVTGDAHIRFYAGAPLKCDGQRIGTLCVVGRRPKALTDNQRRILASLATAAEKAIERRHRQTLAENLRLDFSDIDEATLGQIRNAWFVSTIADSIPALIAYFDPHLICRYVNRTYLQQYGKSAREVVGKPMLELMGENLYDQMVPYARAALAGEPQMFERALLRPDGTQGIALAHYAPDRAANGRVVGFLSHVVDVTAVKDVALRLEAGEAHMRAFVDSSPLGVFYTDTQGALTFVSERWREIFALKSGQSADEAWLALLSRSDQAEAALAWRATTNGGEELDREIALDATRRIRLRARAALSPQGRRLGFVGSAEDVSKEKALLRDLTESGERRRVLAERNETYRAIMESLPDCLNAKDRDGRFIAANPATAQMMGAASVDDLIGKTDFDFYDAEMARGFRQQESLAMAADPPAAIEELIKLPDGAMRWIRTLKTPLRDQGGQILGVITHNGDISEQKRLQLELQNTQNLLNAAVTHMADGLVMFDVNATIELCNQRYRDYFPRTADLRVPGGRLADILRAAVQRGEMSPPTEREAWIEERVAALAQPGEHLLEVQGGLVVEARVSPTEQGRTTVTFSDVTARLKAERATRDSEARYRTLAEATSDVITTLHLDFSRRYASPACRSVLGYEPEEMLALPPSSIIHPEDYPDVERTLSALTTEAVASDSVSCTYRMRHKSGQWVWVEAAIKLMRESQTGAPESLLLVLRDVTERRRASEAAAAEKVGNLKSEFLANMSHELRTPLTGVLGLHDLLATDPTLSPRHMRQIELAREAGRSLLVIVNDILDFSKIESGYLSIEHAPFDLVHVIDACRKLGLPEAMRKSLTLDTDFAALPPFLVGDAVRVRQIILNLVSNAVKFTDRGGVVIRASYDACAERLRVEIVDSGIGVAKDKISSLFERFTQADASITRRFGGTGLGLAISKRLVALMGGKIGVVSEEGRGATFWFELPLRPALAAPPAPTATRASPLTGLNVLLAEDNLVNQEFIQKMLQNRGHRVTAVETGLDALRMLRSVKDFDVVLMDVQMPVMDGLTATAAIRDDERRDNLAPLPIIGLTANAMMEDVKRCVAAGMQGHVAKPIEWGKLFCALEEFVHPTKRRIVAPAAEIPAGRGGIVNEATLDELSHLMGPPSLSRLLTLFADDLQALAAELDLISGDDLAKRCHKLKSSAGQLGFTELNGLFGTVAHRAHNETEEGESRDLRSGLARAMEVARSFADAQ